MKINILLQSFLQQIYYISNQIKILNCKQKLFLITIINSFNIDIEHDIIEISFILISDHIQRCKPLLLNLNLLEINNNVKKLLEMPDKSFVDINYTIKEEFEDKENNNDKILSSEYHKFKENEINLDLNLIKYHSKSIIKKEKDVNSNKIDNNIISKKFYTPSINPKISPILPKKFQLNPNDEQEENLAQKILSKIFNKPTNENLNSSIDIITSREINDVNNNINSSDSNLNGTSFIKYETFCIGIFISGIKSPIEKNTVIENSCNLLAICGHKNCSLLLSFKPELIFTYSNRNSFKSQELNYLVANLCFPLGIKICFEKQEENNIKDKKIITMENNVYYNVMKNAKDEIFYITTLLYFIKMKIKDFRDKYKIDLISYYSQISNSSIKKENNLKKGISLINKLTENDIIYVPETISLLSKYPFCIPMNICLNKIISLQNQEEKNNLINHIINEIPIPQKLKQIQFYIPFENNPIILNNYFNIFKGLLIINENNKDNLSMTQLNSKLLLEKIPIENIVILYQLILLEQQILIIDNNYTILSEIVLILISIIYPLSWINPFLPTLSLNTFQFLQTPVPYIMGIDEYLLNYAYNTKNIYIGKDIIMYNLMKKYFVLSRTRKRANKKDIIHEFKLNFLPEKIEKFMANELKQLKILMESNKMNDKKLDMDIRLVFAKTMTLLIGDYNNYTFYKNNDDMPLFNKEAFIESHKDKQIKLFYNKMTKTQLFNQFLLNESKIYFYNINKNNINIENNTDENFDINNCIDTTYFKKMIEKYPELINNETIRKSSLNLDFRTGQENDEIRRTKRSKSYKRLLFSKKEISNSVSVNDPVDFSEKKITIDFNKVSINSPELKNLTKSHNFNLPIKPNSINNNELNKEKAETTKYNNIIIKKTNKIKKYLIYPYFLPKIIKEQTNSMNPNFIRDKILEYNKEHNIISGDLKHKSYILQKSLILEPDKMEQKNYYMIELNTNINNINLVENNHKNLTEKNNYPIIETKSSIYVENQSSKTIKSQQKNHKKGEKKKNKKLKNEPKLYPKYNLIIKFDDNNENIELINKCFISCCTNKHRITNEQFSSLEKIFSISSNKNYFANLIVPDIRIKNKSQHKQLISTSFEDLKRIMKMCLEKLTYEEKEIGRLLTIACFSYYTIDKEKNIFYLYQCFNEGVVYPCKLWLIDEFWMEFFSIEMSEASKKEDELIKNYDNNNLGEFDNDKSIIEFKSKFAILTENSLYMSKIMIKLNLNQIFIMNIFEKLILPVYESDYDNINIISKKILGLLNSN